MLQSPDMTLTREVTASILGDVTEIERVPEGVSTYVYRIFHGDQTLYLRILPEESSFAIEVHVHHLLRALGVHAPNVVHFEEHNPIVQKSIMITEALPGHPLKGESSPYILRSVLRAAGKEVALLNTIPVQGYGWIDRSESHLLYGERQIFADFYADDLAYGLSRLPALGFSTAEVAPMRSILDALLVQTQHIQARLVHGDFDTTHIFHRDGLYSGMIDFGEIMGNHPLYDLALFRFYDDLPPESGAFDALLEGYSEVTPLSQDDLIVLQRLSLLFGLWKFALQDRKTFRKEAFIAELVRRIRNQLVHI